MTNRFRKVIIAVITFVWAANFTAPIVERSYQPPTEINLAFMGIVGILVSSYDRKKENEPPPEPRARAKAPPKKTVAKKTAKKPAAKKTTQRRKP